MSFFSIIIPTYNSEKDIAACISSIAVQTFQNVEILVQDGLSKDRTVELVSHIQETNPALQIRMNSEKDEGIYDAMNKAVRRATGEWVYFLGSDDRLFDKDVLQNIYAVCSTMQYDVVYGDVFSNRFGGRYDGAFTALKLFDKNICHQAVFMKRSLFNKLGYFNVAFKGHGDWEHNMRWFLSKSVKKTYVDLVVAQYADGGFSSTQSDEAFNSEKTMRYLVLGKSVLPFRQKILLLKGLTGYALVTKNYKLLFRIFLNAPIILL